MESSESDNAHEDGELHSYKDDNTSSDDTQQLEVSVNPTSNFFSVFHRVAKAILIHNCCI